MVQGRLMLSQRVCGSVSGCLLACLLACLLDCFPVSGFVCRWFVLIGLLVCFGTTRWLQPSHRTTPQTGDITNGNVKFCLFVSFCVSLFFDYLCSDQCQNADEYFNKDQPFDGLGRQRNSIIMCAFKPHNFWGVNSASDNDCQRLYILKTTDLMNCL